VLCEPAPSATDLDLAYGSGERNKWDLGHSPDQLLRFGLMTDGWRDSTHERTDSHALVAILISCQRSEGAMLRSHPRRLLAARQQGDLRLPLRGSVGRGWSAALRGYTLAPEASLTQITNELKSAFDWLNARAGEHSIQEFLKGVSPDGDVVPAPRSGDYR
jgi:hypothetical protein